MEVKMEQGWREALSAEFDKPYFRELAERVRSEYADPAVRVYPPASRIFAAFDSCPYDRTEVVIVGGRIRTMAPDRPTACHSRSIPALPCPLSCEYFQGGAGRYRCPASADGDLTRWARQGCFFAEFYLLQSVSISQGLILTSDGNGLRARPSESSIMNART